LAQVIPDICKDKLAFELPQLEDAEAATALTVWQEWYCSAVRQVLRGNGNDVDNSKVKVERAATAWFMKALGHAMRACTSQGLEAFGFHEDGTCKHRLPWPGQGVPPVLSIATDQASVCCSAYYAMQRKFGLTVEMINDASHRVSNDLLGALKAGGPWYECIMLLSIHAKVNYGPWQGEAFLRQLGNTAERIRATVSGQDPLFTALLPAIARDQCKEPSIIGDPNWCQEMFAKLLGDKTCRLKGPCIQLCRWMSWIDCIDYWDDSWHLRLCLMQFWALNEGLRVVDQASETLTAGELAASIPGQARMTMRESKEKGRIAEMRQKGKNGLHAAMFVLQIPCLQTLARMISVTCSPHRSWHGWQAKHVRSVESSHQFFREQASGTCLGPMFEVFRCMHLHANVSKCGFLVDRGEAPEGPLAPDAPWLQEESESMGLWFSLCVNVNFHRLRSMLWHIMGPGLLAGLLPGGRHDLVLARMQAQHAAMQVGLESDSVYDRESVHNSWLRQRFQKCCYEACAAEQWLEPPVQIVRTIEAVFALGSTKVIEDAWQRARCMEDRAQASNTLCPQSLMFTQIQRQVASVVHQYPEVSHTDMDLRQAASLPKVAATTFKSQQVKDDKFPVNAVMGKGKPDWYSTNPAGAAQQYAWIGMLSHFLDHPGRKGLTSKKWLCSLLLPGMLVRRTSSPSQQHFVLGCVDRIACLAWKVEKKVLAGAAFYRPLCQPINEDPWQWLVCLHAEDFQVQPVSWCSIASSWASSSSSRGSSSSSGPSAAPGWAKATGVWEPLLKASALQGFGGLTFGQVKQLVVHLKVAVEASCDYFEQYRRLLLHCHPGFTEMQLLEVLQGIASKKRGLVPAGFWDSPDIVEVFGASDLADVAELASGSDGAGASPKADEAEFQAKLANLSKKVAQAAMPPEPAKPPRKKAKPAEARPVRPDPVPTDVFTEAQAQEYLPPGFTAAKSLLDNRFRVKHPILGARSRTWTKYGETGALGRLARWAWHAFSKWQPHQQELPQHCKWIEAYPLEPW